MAQQVDQAYVENHKEEIVATIKSGALFIYPTDTIYGMGCDATNEASVFKLRSLKERFNKPFSIIAPNKNWIKKYTKVSKEALEKLPGPVTLILSWKNKSILASSINAIDNTIGVRIPDHWFAKIIETAGVPFVTTSVNILGEKHMESLEQVPERILSHIDYVVYEGLKKGEPSVKLKFV